LYIWRYKEITALDGESIIYRGSRTSLIRVYESDIEFCFKGNRENVSSFGKTPVQQNSDEVNSEIQKLEEQRKNPGDAKSDQAGDIAGFDEQNIGTNDEDSFVQPRGANSLYRWVDKEGVIHVTDDISSIPAEYRDQAYKGK